MAVLLQTIFALVAGIGVIIFLTVRLKLHPFFALLIACFVTGLAAGLPVEEIMKLIKAGIGDILSKLTLIIVLGTTIGVLLEKNGSTRVMAEMILRIVGTKRSSFSLAVTGFIVGLPIFCDSGYIVLNGINTSMIRRTGYSVARMSISLAAGLYAVHCLVPPHPGATAAAGTLNVDFGKLILYGIAIAIPAMLAGYWWAVYSERKNNNVAKERMANEKTETEIESPAPPPVLAFLPVMVPIVLMSVKSIIDINAQPSLWSRIFSVVGDPAVALAVGVVLALISTRGKKELLPQHLGSAVEKAAAILIIISAGAAFGAVLSATRIGEHFSSSLNIAAMGIWFPFLLTTIIKTAQGSSTVAIITASSIVLPLLPVLGLDSDNARILTVLAMGAGSMMISHTNDAYFWVISRFSVIDIKTMLRVHSLASLWMGLAAMIVVYVLSLLIL
jgi:gluconate:H+ symporter, GntP family